MLLHRLYVCKSFITEINSYSFLFLKIHIYYVKYGTVQICKILSKYEVFMLLTMKRK